VVFVLDMGALILWEFSGGNKQNNVQTQISVESISVDNTEKKIWLSLSTAMIKTYQVVIW